MRPLKLRISGLRSWRAEQVVDFKDIDLAAVVGPTGAGKSSILEAIVYALYNTTTYEGNIKSLISADGNTVSVAFDFEADGERWRITRSTSRSGYPPPVHKLACLSDPAAHPMVEGRTPVNDAIVRLLGLNVDQFTSAVLLPQGRFQRLLTATDGERTGILKGVFRLDELDETRARAVSLRVDEVVPALDAAQEERSALLPDPAAELEAARVDHAAAETQITTLDGLVARHAEHRARALEHTAAAASARETASTLSETLAAIPSLDAAIVAEARLAAREAAVDRRAALAASARTAEAVHAADAAGDTLSAVSGAKQVLTHAAEALPRHADRRAALERQRAALQADLTALTQDRAALETKRAALVPLVIERDRLADAVKTARTRLDLAQTRLREARSAVQQRTVAAAGVMEAEAAFTDAEAAAADAVQAAAVAQGRLDAAEDVLEATRRGHEAAHLAAGLAPGDDCPVCHRVIADGFTPGPAPAALAGAQAVVEAERGARDTAREAATAASTTATVRGTALASARTAHDQAVAAVTAAFAAAVASDVVLDEATLDDEDLAAFTAAVTRGDAAWREADTGLTREETAIEATAAHIATRATDLRAREEPLADDETALADEQAALLAQLDALPESVRLTSHAPADLSAARDAVGARLATIEALHRADREATTALRNIDDELDIVRSERETYVETPRRSALRHGEALAALIDEAPPQPEPHAPLTVDAAWLTELSTAAHRRIDALAGAAEAGEREAQVANAAAEDLLTGAGFADASALQAGVSEYRGQRYVAERRIRTAQEQVPLVKALARRIEALKARREALDEVARLLNDGQFVGWLVQRRQRLLLTVASEILAGMTGDRYRFAVDFTVVDGRSGQPRSPRTLSGGESFLASLALALGMAELAARGGGRIGSLYLDEGFGSLDPNALDQAIEALEARARAGQMIMVISHVPTVAQRIERVLRVTPSPAGSAAEWLDDADRETLLTPADLA